MFESDSAKEKQRLVELYRYNILDTPSEESFDRITRLAAITLNMPVALITLVDRNRQWFKSRQGTDVTESPRDISFCSHAIQHDNPMLVHDLRKDARFSENPFVAEKPHLRFYCGVPLRTRNHFNLGTLCVLDTKTRRLKENDMTVLVDLARLVIDEIELRQVAETDYLTGVATRRVLFTEAEKEIDRAQRHGRDLSVIAFDIDYFKKVNDRYGHLFGDQVLQAVARVCKANIRSTDLLARTGGEEFTILLPDTSLEDAAQVAEKVRTSLMAMEVKHEKQLVGVTCSFGVTSYKSDDEDFNALLHRADQGLYQAKSNGRNRSLIIQPKEEVRANYSFGQVPTVASVYR
jgi:diguanylate cyclase (GGDEF)-like protein